tara:strand:+ start:2193 stop:2462 length:270 start_codon:yes stop_codon:yes gene_type:complete
MDTNCLRKILPKELLLRIVRVSHVTEKPSYLTIKDIISSVQTSPDSGAHRMYQLHLASVLHKEIQSFSKENNLDLNVDVGDYMLGGKYY